MMAKANFPITFLGDVLLTAAYVLNCVPSKSVTSTPYELWIGRKSDLSFLKPWGCAAYTHESSHKYGKLGPRREKGIFIRYSETSKGYVFIGEQDSGSITEFESRDVIFLENEFPKKGEIGEDNSLFETLDNDNEDTILSLHPSGSDVRSGELSMNQSQSQSQSLDESIPSLPDPSGSDMENRIQSPI